MFFVTQPPLSLTPSQWEAPTPPHPLPPPPPHPHPLTPSLTPNKDLSSSGRQYFFCKQPKFPMKRSASICSGKISIATKKATSSKQLCRGQHWKEPALPFKKLPVVKLSSDFF